MFGSFGAVGLPVRAPGLWWAVPPVLALLWRGRPGGCGCWLLCRSVPLLAPPVCSLFFFVLSSPAVWLWPSGVPVAAACGLLLACGGALCLLLSRSGSLVALCSAARLAAGSVSPSSVPVALRRLCWPLVRARSASALCARLARPAGPLPRVCAAGKGACCGCCCSVWLRWGRLRAGLRLGLGGWAWCCVLGRGRLGRRGSCPGRPCGPAGSLCWLGGRLGCRVPRWVPARVLRSVFPLAAGVRGVLRGLVLGGGCLARGCSRRALLGGVSWLGLFVCSGCPSPGAVVAPPVVSPAARVARALLPARSRPARCRGSASLRGLWLAPAWGGSPSASVRAWACSARACAGACGRCASPCRWRACPAPLLLVVPPAAGAAALAGCGLPRLARGSRGCPAGALRVRCPALAWLCSRRCSCAPAVCCASCPPGAQPLRLACRSVAPWARGLAGPDHPSLLPRAVSLAARGGVGTGPLRGRLLASPLFRGDRPPRGADLAPAVFVRTCGRAGATLARNCVARRGW